MPRASDTEGPSVATSESPGGKRLDLMPHKPALQLRLPVSPTPPLTRAAPRPPPPNAPAPRKLVAPALLAAPPPPDSPGLRGPPGSCDPCFLGLRKLHRWVIGPEGGRYMIFCPRRESAIFTII